MVTVRQETPLQPEIAQLLQESDALAAVLYPGAYRRPLDPAALDKPDIRLFVARCHGTAVGCCALMEMGDGAAELKRMIVSAEARGRGAGFALLSGAEQSAVAAGLSWIRMEVGTRNIDGQSLYRRAGYVERGPFGTYQPSPISLFFEKKLGE